MLRILLFHPFGMREGAKEVDVDGKSLAVRETEADDLAVERADFVLELNFNADKTPDTKSGDNALFRVPGLEVRVSLAVHDDNVGGVLREKERCGFWEVVDGLVRILHALKG